MGFELLVADEYAAPTATAVKPRPEFTAAELIQWLEAERGICIAGGIGELAGKIFRIGHLGKSTTDAYLAEFWPAMKSPFFGTQGRIYHTSLPIGFPQSISPAS